MTELIQKLLSITILLAIGWLMRRSKLLHDNVIDGLKTIIIKIALPAVLFTAFAQVRLQWSYMILFAVFILYCFLLHLAGDLAHKASPKLFPYSHTGSFTTGFEFGMIGVGLFGALWGMDKLPVIMLVGFGHELFIWFYYAPRLNRANTGHTGFLAIFRQFIKTPTILAILLGVAVNLAGWYEPIGASIIGGSFYEAMAYVTPLTSPLILIVIGHSLKFGSLDPKKTLAYLGFRSFFVLGLGTLAYWLIISLVDGLDPIFATAFYAFILLPAPYIQPLYIKEKKEAAYFSQLLVYGTLLTFVGYIVLVII